MNIESTKSYNDEIFFYQNSLVSLCSTNNTPSITDDCFDPFIEQEKKILDISQKPTLSVFDVAAYILSRISGKECSTMKLHKLLYYSQAWSLVWDEKPLFSEKIEAWANGPVIREVFNFHKGLFSISYNDLLIGNDSLLDDEQKATVDSVIKFYGDKSAQWLSDLTHMEEPWIKARTGLGSLERGTREILLDDMCNYYSGL